MDELVKGRTEVNHIIVRLSIGYWLFDELIDISNVDVSVLK